MVSASLPSESCYVRADISNQDEAHALIDGTIERYGQLDFLINNAGWTTSIPHDQLDDLTDEEEGEHPKEACALAKLCDKLCEDYELCGMNIPDRLGVSVLEPEIADRYTAYCVPTSPH